MTFTVAEPHRRRSSTRRHWRARAPAVAPGENWPACRPPLEVNDYSMRRATPVIGVQAGGSLAGNDSCPVSSTRSAPSCPSFSFARSSVSPLLPEFSPWDGRSRETAVCGLDLAIGFHQWRMGLDTPFYAESIFLGINSFGHVSAYRPPKGSEAYIRVQGPYQTLRGGS